MNKKKLLWLYIFSSIVWIFGTNYLLDQFEPFPLIHFLERIKEVLYVFITGWLFYFCLNKKEELNVSKEEEKRLSTLINSMVDFVNFKDGEGRWIEANEFGLKLFQLENVDYKGKKDSELAEYTEFYGDALRYCEVSDEMAWENGDITRIEEVIPLPDGTTKTFDTIKVPLYHSDGSRKGLVIIGRDITERKHVETLLEESKQQYKSLFEYNPDIVYMIDLEGNITNLNPQFKVSTGFDAEEFIGKNVKDILPNDQKEQILKLISNVIFDQKPQSFELDVLHKSGDSITLQCTALPIIVNKKIAGIIGYGKDITEMRKTEERLRRAEKLSVVGELSASVAHEIRNPLTSLKGFVQLLQMEDEKHQYYYQIMLDELNRINHIVGELLLLAKPQQIKFTKADLRNILFDVISLLKTEAALHNIEIDFIFQDNEYMIECEPNQLKQLFINIIKNAIEASTSGDTVSVFLNKEENEKISITVKDNGCGISKERLKKLGEPFYSSKEKGTGLGLTVSYKIVQSHNGTIQFDSEKNKGTEVNIVLPTGIENTVEPTPEVIKEIGA
ncbi:PAS domain-containing sensor histidine kinase [Bacillus methanolicus]|uniref:histidine kinase n=1 Tax=Bacillus methanolicus (strain MGA3 / ATCC 53907) TaxID=796606 RepID=I3E325_BACMM|nr:PAS domain-containing sensor histidine kinase [Bacillus methanolicus]AIE59011.1 PAS two-component sensor histidine kinase [Bacillus methanolicus MGA3]EIJ80896.1 two-component sensor histidine kinase [Bacillus methanolicus MGA3]